MTVYQCRDRQGSTYLLDAPSRDLVVAWLACHHGRSVLPVSVRALPAGDVMRLVRTTGVRPLKARRTPRVQREMERLAYIRTGGAL